MAYALYTDVENEFKAMDFDDSETAIQAAEVTEWIDQASNTIDGMLSSRYETPISGPLSLSMLKMITIWLVKARILSIISVKTPQDKQKQDPDGPSLYKQAMDLLAKLKSGAIKLPDAELSGTGGGMESYLRTQTVNRKFSVERNDW